MKTVKDLRDLLDKIDSIQYQVLEKYRNSPDSISSDDISSFNCTVYQLGRAFDILNMAINRDWGF